MPRKGEKHTPEALRRIRETRARQEAMKYARHGLYATGKRFPAEIQDIVTMADQVIEELVDSELGGPGNVKPSQWIHLAALRSAMVIAHATTRYAAARGIINKETHDLENVLKHSGGWHDRVGKALSALGLSGDGRVPELDIGQRMKLLETKAKEVGNGDQ